MFDTQTSDVVYGKSNHVGLALGLGRMALTTATSESFGTCTMREDRRPRNAIQNTSEMLSMFQRQLSTLGTYTTMQNNRQITIRTMVGASVVLEPSMPRRNRDDASSIASPMD